MISILLVDDHPFLREGVAAVLQRQADMCLVGEAENGEEALESFRALKPDIVLMDLQMPGFGGLEAIIAIRSEAPTAKIVVLTTFDGDVQAYRAMKAGASAYLLKSSLRTELIETIRTVNLGGRRLSPEIAEKIAMYAIDDRVSEREAEVLHLISRGQSNKSIAHRLSITEATVKTHLKSIFLKLDVADRTHAVTVAARRGIITL